MNSIASYYVRKMILLLPIHPTIRYHHLFSLHLQLTVLPLVVVDFSLHFMVLVAVVSPKVVEESGIPCDLLLYNSPPLLIIHIYSVTTVQVLVI